MCPAPTGDGKERTEVGAGVAAAAAVTVEQHVLVDINTRSQHHQASRTRCSGLQHKMVLRVSSWLDF